jgi:hypothetical protein
MFLLYVVVQWSTSFRLLWSLRRVFTSRPQNQLARDINGLAATEVDRCTVYYCASTRRDRDANGKRVPRKGRNRLESLYDQIQL